MDNQRRYRRPNSDVKEDKMDQREQEQRPVRREYGSSTAADSIGQARRVIDQLEARINDARRVPMSKTLSIVDAGELIDLIGQLRIVLPHTVVQAQAIFEQQKQILGDAKAEADRTADKADEIYTTTVEKAKQFEQEVKADADAYDKQIRQKAQEDSNAIIEDANTRANQIIFSAQQQSQKLVDDNEITRRAQAYAVETRERAEKDADSIYNQQNRAAGIRHTAEMAHISQRRSAITAPDMSARSSARQSKRPCVTPHTCKKRWFCVKIDKPPKPVSTAMLTSRAKDALDVWISRRMPPAISSTDCR